jgi:hypothetical protein
MNVNAGATSAANKNQANTIDYWMDYYESSGNLSSSVPEFCSRFEYQALDERAEFVAALTQLRSLSDFQGQFRVLLASGQGDPWLGHFFLDARTRRVILRFRRFLLRHGTTLPPRRRSFHSLLHSVTV